jgi:hypothetical protein
MQTASIALDNNGRAITVQSFQNVNRQDKTSQAQSQESQLRNEKTPEKRDADATVQISNVSQEAYKKSHQVSESAGSDKGGMNGDPDATSQLRQFEEGSVRKLPSDKAAESEIPAGADNKQSTGKLQDFKLPNIKETA